MSFAAAAGPTGHMLRDVAVAAAILIIALIPVSAYATLTRRRDQRAARAAASQRAQGTRDALAGAPAQELLRYFGPRHARQANAADLIGPGVGAMRAGPAWPPGWPGPPGPPGPPWLAGPGSGSAEPTVGGGTREIDVFSPRPPAAHDTIGERSVAVPPAGPIAAAPVFPARPDSRVSPSAGSRGPASHRAHGGQRGKRQDPVAAADLEADPRRTVRHTPVSGKPPWEPARPPSTIGPWAAVTPAGPPGEVGPAQVDPASPAPGQDPASRPIYVWNPPESTTG